MACHSGPCDCHLGKNDHDINKTCISLYFIPRHLTDKVNSIKASRHLLVHSPGSSDIVVKLTPAVGRVKHNSVFHSLLGLVYMTEG